MTGFTSQPDEGYSEDPLNLPPTTTSLPLKPREDGITVLGPARSGDNFPPWLIRHLSSLSISRKTELAMALLNDLPTSVISQIVENLYPRLYIDFVRYLPPEVCLKILGYLDPVSLINVARCCRAWYDLALDRKLWEQLYYLEGWKALPGDIAAAEREMNASSSQAGPHHVLRRMQSHEDGHAYKKRAIALSPALDADTDTVMLDAGSAGKQEPTESDSMETSIFGGQRRNSPKIGVPQRMMGDFDMSSAGSNSSSKGKEIDKGKGRASSSDFAESAHISDAFLQTALAPPRLDKSTLWVWDASSTQFKMNWKYLYTMRRRLEANWERGRYINFQFPHPDHLDEGHVECIYSLQFNAQYLVSGSRDRTLKVWDMETRRCLRTLAKHRGSVLCLQFDSDPEEDLIVSGSSDSDIVVWKFSTGKPIQTLRHAHRESVLNVRFDKRILVTCSKDKTIKVFNRRTLRHGDLGYQEVDPVPRTVQDYGYSIPMTPDDFPVIPAWTMIACLDGHSAAVNAVQIHDREVVSASGDRHIKVWDWPTQVCSRTIVGHNKGIACVQYDGRRIVSGSSDNEVKVFDRETGLEVANLRSHSSLVRTVQAGFGDLPYSAEDDLAAAKKVDEDYFKALQSGVLQEHARPRSGRRVGNAGSRRPEDICAYGAKLPPGGGGGKYGRIVSGSYDASIIIWRRDKEGLWKDQHHFKQEAAAFHALQQDRTPPFVLRDRSQQTARDWHASSLPSPREPAAAGPSASRPANPAPRSQTASAPPGSATGPTQPPFTTPTAELNLPEGSTTAPLRIPLIDAAVQGGQQALSQAIAAHPAILHQRSYVEAAIDRLQNPVVRSQLRQTFSTALIRAQFEQGRQRREALRAQEAALAGSAGQGSSAAAQDVSAAAAAASSAGQSSSSDQPAVSQAAPLHHLLNPVPATATVVPVPVAGPAAASSSAPPATANAAAAAALPAPAAATAHHPHIAQAPPAGPFEVHDPANPARVFKLQYDARRIICCSQRSVIVGWDFCNGDAELEEASRFFRTVD